MKLIYGVIASALAACSAKPAPESARPPDSGKPVERLSGLDTALIDKTADPCVDFFQYACGNFAKLYPIPADRSSFGTGSMLVEYVNQTLHDILDHAAAAGSERTPNEQKIGDDYAACMDEAAIAKHGLAPLQPELDRIAQLTSKNQLAELLAHYQLIGVGAFLGFGEQQDFKDARKQIAVVGMGGLGLPERDYYFRTGAEPDKTRAAYVQHVAKIFALLGTPDAKAKTDADAVMALETALAKVTLDIVAQREPSNVYHLMSVTDLAGLAPNFDWKRFLAATGAPQVSELNVVSPEFVRGLGAVLESTDLETIKAYLRWQLIAAIPSVVLPPALDAEQFAFFGHTLQGQPQQRARWKRCVAATDSQIGEALGQVYVTRAFPPDAKAAALQMVRDIEAAMDADIDTLDWMSAETKTRAKQKLRSVADKIGYPEHWRDYSALTISRDDALGNAVRANEFESRRQLAKIGKPIDRGEWGITPATVDAYYNPSMNDINFPAAILQPPFYDPRATDAENYGHVGGIVGHELTHGFDDEGRKFDGAGNLADWWGAEDNKRFDDKAACEVAEYGSFVAVGDVKVNGKLTLGENTADNGGLRLAYAAFLADAKRKAIDLSQQQDGFTPAQQFFLGHGQNWCGEVRPEQVRLQVQTDPHSPRQFRVNGVVQNMPEFGAAFGCKVGQPMMPANACRVW